MFGSLKILKKGEKKCKEIGFIFRYHENLWIYIYTHTRYKGKNPIFLKKKKVRKVQNLMRKFWNLILYIFYFYMDKQIRENFYNFILCAYFLPFFFEFSFLKPWRTNNILDDGLVTLNVLSIYSSFYLVLFWSSTHT